MKSALGLIFGRGWTSLCALGTFLVIGRYLSPFEFGLYALASTAALLPHLTVGAGVFEYVVGRDPEGRHEPTAQSWSMLSGVLATGVILLFAGLASYLGQDHVASMLRWLSVSSLIWGLVAVQEAALIRDGRGDLVAGVVSGSETLGFIAMAWMLYAGFGIDALVFGRVASSVSTLFGYGAARRGRIRFGLDRAAARDMLRFSPGMFGNKLLEWANGHGSDLLLSIFMPTAGLGIFRMGSRLYMAGFSIMAAPSHAVLSYLGKVRAEAPWRMGMAARRSLRMQSLLGAPIFAATAILAPDLLRLVLGHEWHDSGLVLAAFCLSGPLAFGHITAGNVMLSFGHSGRVFRYQVVMTIPLAVLLSLGALGGPVTAAIAKGCYAILLAATMMLRLREVDRETRRACLRSMAAMLFATLCMVGWGAGVLEMVATQAGLAHRLLALAAAVVSGYGIFLLAVRLADPPSFRLLRALRRIALRLLARRRAGGGELALGAGLPLATK